MAHCNCSGGHDGLQRHGRQGAGVREAEHPEQVEGAGEKAGEFGKERFAGHDEQIDQGVDKFKDWVPGGEGGEAQPPAEPPA